MEQIVDNALKWLLETLRRMGMEEEDTQIIEQAETAFLYGWDQIRNITDAGEREAESMFLVNDTLKALFDLSPNATTRHIIGYAKVRFALALNKAQRRGKVPSLSSEDFGLPLSIKKVDEMPPDAWSIPSEARHVSPPLPAPDTLMEELYGKFLGCPTSSGRPTACGGRPTGKTADAATNTEPPRLANAACNTGPDTTTGVGAEGPRLERPWHQREYPKLDRPYNRDDWPTTSLAWPMHCPLEEMWRTLHHALLEVSSAWNFVRLLTFETLARFADFTSYAGAAQMAQGWHEKISLWQAYALAVREVRDARARERNAPAEEQPGENTTTPLNESARSDSTTNISVEATSSGRGVVNVTVIHGGGGNRRGQRAEALPRDFKKKRSRRNKDPNRQANPNARDPEGRRDGLSLSEAQGCPRCGHPGISRSNRCPNILRHPPLKKKGNQNRPP